MRPQCAKTFPLIKWKIRNFGPISLKFGIGTPLDPKWRIPESGLLRVRRTPAVHKIVYAYLVKIHNFGPISLKFGIQPLNNNIVTQTNERDTSEASILRVFLILFNT